MPPTAEKIDTPWGERRTTYINYYEGNEVILFPIYDDPNDEKALGIIRGLYPKKRIVPINCRQLFYYGGMLHCITQQQPE